MATKESYPIYSMICYTVVAVGLYSIYSTYTSKKPSSPEPVVAKAAPAKVNKSATPSLPKKSEDPVVKNDPIVIKGIYIGMSKENFEQVTSEEYATRYTTIGGVKSMFYLPEFENNKLVAITASYDDKSGWAFSNVKEAVMSKYPLKCQSGVARNRMNAQFETEYCSHISNNVSLTVTRRSTSVDSSHFSMMDTSWAKRKNDREIQKARKDI
jgi:hypothetical protein